MKFKLSRTIGVAFGIAAAPIAHCSSIVQNGRFDTDINLSVPYLDLTDGSTTISGWTYTPVGNGVYVDNGTQPIGTYGLPSFSPNSDTPATVYAEFTSLLGSADTLSQTLATVPGQAYELKFLINTGYGGSNLLVNWGGSQAYSADTTLVTYGSGKPGEFNNGWATIDLYETATSSSTNLAFTGASNNYLGVTDVAVSAVPEPASLSLVSLGSVLGMFGLRRRK